MHLRQINVPEHDCDNLPQTIVIYGDKTMFKLAATSFVFIAPTLMGIFVTAILTMRMTNGPYITYAAVAGLVLAIPVSWFVASRINKLTKTS